MEGLRCHGDLLAQPASVRITMACSSHWRPVGVAAADMSVVSGERVKEKKISSEKLTKSSDLISPQFTSEQAAILLADSS